MTSPIHENLDEFKPTLEQAAYWRDMDPFDRMMLRAKLRLLGVDVDRLQRIYAEKLAEAN
jgi:hypothetical protein